MTSAHQSVDLDDLDDLRRRVTAFREAGLGLLIFYLPPPHRALALEPIAEIAAQVG